MPWEAFVYGGLAAMTAEAITFPIDMSKTRLQIQARIVKSIGNVRRTSALHIRASPAFFTYARHPHISPIRFNLSFQL